jgi:hypothetical protein
MHWNVGNCTTKRTNKQMLHCGFKFDIFLRVFFLAKKLSLPDFQYVLYYGLSLANRQSTFRDTLLISYSSVEIVKNISLQQYVFEIIFRNVDNKLPGDTASHLSSRNTEWSWTWWVWGTDNREGIERKDFKGYLEICVIVWCSCERASLVWSDVWDQLDAIIMIY